MTNGKERKSAAELARIIRERLSLPDGIKIRVWPHDIWGWFAVAYPEWATVSFRQDLEDSLLPELCARYDLAQESAVPEIDATPSHTTANDNAGNRVARRERKSAEQLAAIVKQRAGFAHCVDIRISPGAEPGSWWARTPSPREQWELGFFLPVLRKRFELAED